MLISCKKTPSKKHSECFTNYLGIVVQLTGHRKLTITASKHPIQSPPTTIITNHKKGVSLDSWNFLTFILEPALKLAPWILGSSHKMWTQKGRGYEGRGGVDVPFSTAEIYPCF